jgi:hypothetical protein
MYISLKTSFASLHLFEKISDYLETQVRLGRNQESKLQLKTIIWSELKIVT